MKTQNATFAHSANGANGPSKLKSTPALPAVASQPEAKPTEATKPEPAEAPEPVSQAKEESQPKATPAPVPVATQIEQVMRQFQQMEKLTKAHKMLKTTSEELGQFDFKPTDEINNTVTLYLSDSKGHRFETKNANLIEPLIQFLQQVLADKTTEIERELLTYKAPN